MPEEADKREHSAKPEVDDLTDYQSLNSLGGAGVLVKVKETPPAGPEEKPTASNNSDPPTGIEYSGDYNDGADFTTVDNKGQTNA